MLIDSEELKAWLQNTYTNRCSLSHASMKEDVLKKISELEKKQQEECPHDFDLIHGNTATCVRCGDIVSVSLDLNYIGRI